MDSDCSAGKSSASVRTPSSPCIDVGDSGKDYSGQKDIDGDNRVIDVSGKGDGDNDVDMGVDEYDPS